MALEVKNRMSRELISDVITLNFYQDTKSLGTYLPIVCVVQDH